MTFQKYFGKLHPFVSSIVPVFIEEDIVEAFGENKSRVYCLKS